MAQPRDYELCFGDFSGVISGSSSLQLGLKRSTDLLNKPYGVTLSEGSQAMEVENACGRCLELHPISGEDAGRV